MAMAESKSMSMSHLVVTLCAVFSLLLSHGAEASHHPYRGVQPIPQPTVHTKLHRTSYHFQPPKNWINDPNGPMIYKGLYHLFYQYNPKGAVWGNIVWAHSTSTDLVNWTPHPAAIYPSVPSDIQGCWSGSATILPGYKPAIIYTGINTLGQQVQNLAVPKNLSDPYLIEWVKPPYNPLMAPTTQNMINASSFRDPTTAWLGHNGKWRVIIGSKRNSTGMVILYRSKDFIHWTEAKQPLHSAQGTGMWECPDFYPVSTKSLVGLDTSVNGIDVKHVLKVSLDDTKHDHYTIGIYDPVKDVYVPDKGSIEGETGLRYDYGKFYASKTFFDSSKNRRILWGWINESTTEEADIKKGWSGIQIIPRTIRLDKSGKQLVQWPVPEIEKLRTHRVGLPDKSIEGGTVLEVSGVTAAQADVEVSFELTLPELEKAETFDPSWTDPQLLCSQKGASVKGSLGPFGLLVFASKGLQEYTAVFFRIFKGQNEYVVLMCSDQSRSSLDTTTDKTPYGAFVDVNPARKKLSLRTLIDHSIVESFGGYGKSCITARVYPVLAVEEGAHLHVFNNGTQSVGISGLSAWSMEKAKIN